MEQAGVGRDQVRHFVPHQANGVMLGEVWPRLDLPGATMHLELERYGNTGSASVPITLDIAHRRGEFAEGETVLMAGFGGGMTVGAILTRWASTAFARPGTRHVAATVG
ncbi:3-oxoacyl-[acyl-carrier-protein] synthase III C-terminal domain-containing protein [Streptomyces nogalater]